MWGLTPAQLHERFWASRGVQVVRQGQSQPLRPEAELFLLVPPWTLASFQMDPLVDALSWHRPRLVVARLHARIEQGYREQVLADEANRFAGFQRLYQRADRRLDRVGLTPERTLARLWQDMPNVRTAWQLLRRAIPREQRTTVSVPADLYDDRDADEQARFVRDLVRIWQRPDLTVPRADRRGESVWADAATREPERTRVVGPVWIGAGRRLEDVDSLVGPAVLWDDPGARPVVDDPPPPPAEPAQVIEPPARPRELSRAQRLGKRSFDIAFSLAVLGATLPLFPFLMLAIWLEDGRPFFFAHRRQTRGGAEFPCLKFRSMLKNADEIKARIQAENRADGPQFYIENDPRLTKVGGFLRRFNLDELPQFLNVLAGHMSVVGPRPSPHKENQYCPAWREARLSVRPGVTGLWQVKRSRAAGLDFQEWIRYDLEYVEKMSWSMDLWIILRTIMHVLRIRKAGG